MLSAGRKAGRSIWAWKKETVNGILCQMFNSSKEFQDGAFCQQIYAYCFLGRQRCSAFQIKFMPTVANINLESRVVTLQKLEVAY
jgi:hypothetical protein